MLAWESNIVRPRHRSQPNMKTNHPQITTPESLKKARRAFETYCERTTLHGLRYCGDRSLSFGERFFWLAAFVVAIAFAAYFISNIYRKWQMNPVLIGFSPYDAGFEEIPFPAITICNMNQAKKEEAEAILREGNLIENELLSDACHFNMTDELHFDSGSNWKIMSKFMLRVGQSCFDLLKSCKWRSDKVNCDEFFNNDLTDEGLCCSFNRLPPRNIFKNPQKVPQLNQTYASNVYDWTPEQGFNHRFSGSDTVVPLRPFGAGTHLGLSLVLDADIDNYYCSSTSSAGFKILLSNPIETPKMADFGFFVSPGLESRIKINPTIIEAAESLRGVPIETRQCYFANERQLYYYRTYTERNCRLECQSNYTLRQCNCIPYFLPKNNDEKVCGKKDEECTTQAKEDMELTNGNASSCHCLIACFEMNFDKSLSSSKLTNVATMRQEFNLTDDYFQNNIAIVHFFFKDSKYRKQIKSELYGFTEILANIGGLLGLFLGFSFLSVIEMFYYLTLKPLCLTIRSHKHKDRFKQSVDTRNGVYPFRK